MAETSDRVSRLSETQLALLEKRRRGVFVPKNERSKIVSRERNGRLPLSFAQQRLWFLNQLEPENPFYNISKVMRLKGELNLDALDRTVNEIVRRHEVLRTRFVHEDGEPWQEVSEVGEVKLAVTDLSGFDEAGREAAIAELIKAESAVLFDLARGPLLRVKVLRLSENDHVLAMTMHHIVSDGWSMLVLIKEVTALYAAYSRGEESPLPELPVQYADFAVWQREWLQGEELERQLSYWRKQLSELPVLELPCDRPRPALLNYRGAQFDFSLPPELVAGLKDLSSREGVTLFMTLLAAFQTLLHRYSGQPEIVVGTAIANRNHAEIESLIGFFVNTLVLRTDMGGEPAFLELLQRVKEVCLGAYAHQDVPFEKLVDELQPERDLSRSPLFQTMFLLQNLGQQQTTGGSSGLRVSGLAGETKTAKLDLLVSANETANGLELNVDYSTDLFDEERIARMMRHFEVLLRGAVAHPEQRLWQFPLLDAAEQQQLLVDWNATAREYPRERCIADIFERQAALGPDAIAAVYEGEQLTYRELNERSNQLAHSLRRRGVGPDTLVGICMERSLEMVTALLGILKAGGAYLPLDPEYPQARLALMVEESGARIVLTHGEMAAGLDLAGVSCVRLDEQWAAVALESRENPEPLASSENLAYVSYTSGSTGRPKGVAVPHRAVLRLVCNTNYIELDQQDVVLQMAPLSFDASTLELWGALLNGGRLVVMRAGPVTFAELAEVLVDQQVTTLWLTAGLFHLMVTEQLEALAGVSKLLAGGDVLSPGAVDEVLTAGSGVLINGYGPTENTTFSCCHVMERGVGARLAGATVPIGRAVANTRVYVVDEAMQLVPVGVNGELLLGGDGLARGYLQQAELTAASFVPDPFSGEAGARLYRTGDVVRYRANGELEFVGRRDEQVKVRGYRIELGEVELALTSHPAVRESVVVARAGSESGKRLIAYVVWREGEAVSAGELREYLSERLPEYMIPAQVVELEELPLNANGKVERRALPLPEEVGAGHAAEFVAPRTAAEEILANIWAKLLGLERVSIHDNFFELGGDSIISIQAIARANQAGLQLSPKELFQHQTVAKLAAVAGSAKFNHAEQGVVTGSVELTPIQHWFFEQELIDPHHFNQSLLLQVNRQIDPLILRDAAQRLSIHHDALRLRYQRTAEGWQQFHAPADEQVAFRVIDLSDVAQDEQAAKIESAAEEAQASLSLSDGPLLRLVYFDPGPEQPARLLIVCHHLVVDGVSWRILLEDLQTAYSQLAAGERVKLPAKTTSFKQWAATLKDYSSSKPVIVQSAYWLDISQRAFAAVPRDHTGENRIDSLQTINVALSAAETDALLHEVPAVYHTHINEVLLAALALTLTKWTGSPRVLIDMEGHGREQISEQVDVSRTVGWFTTIYPVLLEVNGHRAGEQVGEVLKSVKEQLRAVPEQGIGYGLLRYLNEELRATLKALPERDVVFNYLGQVGRVLGENSAFGVATEFGGNPRSPRAKRDHLLEISSLVGAGRLQLSWMYSDQVHNRETIEQLAHNYIKALQQIIRHCQSDEAGGYTPSDFPLAQVTQTELDEVLARQAVVEDLYRLSPMQQGLLFHCLYAPQSGLYFEQMQNRFEGEFEVEGLKSAWRQVLERHPILRSSYHWEGLSSPVQLVRAAVQPEWLDEDWRELSSDAQEQKLERLLAADRERGFDFTRAPLMRFALLRLGDDVWQFVWSFHHMLLDGWCMSLLINEVFRYYEAYCRGEQLELAHPRPYRDYIQWLEAQDKTAAETYWRKRLAGFTSPTSLGIAAPASALHPSSGSYSEQEIFLSEQTTSELERLARQQQVTLNTVVQGAWAILLSRYSGESDVVFGATVSGRPAELAGVEQMVGLFINSLPVRVRMRGELQLGEWLQELQREQAEMRQYEYSPLVEVQGWSEVERGVPLFESLFAFENYPVEQLAAGTVESVGRVRHEQVWAMERTNYPLTLIAAPGRKLLLKALYEEQRLDRKVITRLLGHFEQLLESMVNRTEQQLSELRLLTASEEEQLLVEWNATEREYPREQCLAEMFEQQVVLTPEAIAVIHEGKQLSYRELNERSNQLAHYLRRLDVGPGTLVGVCLERSIDFMVAVLGTLKAGGGYVPLDPDYPAERLRLMVDDPGLRVVLTKGQWLDRLPQGDGRQLIDITDGAAWASESQTNPGVLVDRDDVAYVIFTSGSTGRPKGVLGLHRGMVNRFHWMWNLYPFAADEVCCQKTSISFGDSVWETFGPLFQGIPTVIISNDEVKDIDRFIDVLARYGVTRVVLVPSLLRVILDARDIGTRLSKLKYCVCSGEALPSDLAHIFQERLPNCTLLNLYGSSEVSADATYHEVAKDEVETSVSIGRPLSNIQIYILDKQMQPLPVGARGDLYVGGDALARGYVQRADVTAEQFVPHPYSAIGGERLYRTGDEARYLEDGRIEFLGRRDHQVKVRGFRIELGEIEAVLKAHSGVRQAVVTMREQQQLVAYVVAAEESRFGSEREIAAELGRFLRERLPEYMLPQRWVVLDQMPLTASGKLDRQRLPAPVIERHLESDEESVWTPAEEMVAGIWGEVLKLSAVARDENFFELGGHSLLATQVISRVRQMFGVELPLRRLFEEPTVRGLSRSIEEQLRAGAGVTVPAMRRLTVEEREQRGGLLPLSFAQQRVWFLDQLQPESAFYNMGTAMRLKGELNIAALGRALSEIVRRHEVLRTRFVDVSGEPRQEVQPAEELKLLVTDLSGFEETEREAEVRREVVSESQAPFDLAHGPLVRVKLWRLNDEDHVMVLMMHHIVSDGWSMGVLVKELTTLYEVYSQGEVSPLPELSLQYADFAVWQREWLQGEELERQLGYWREQLRELPVLELPTDRARPAVQSYRGAELSVRLPEELSAQLRELSRREGVTLFMTLLAAFQTLLQRYSGQEEIVVGTAIANRNLAQTEGLIGFFANTLVLRSDVSGEPTFVELLQRVKEVCLGAYAHQDVPFEKLVEELQPERDLSRSPLFQTMFILQNLVRPVLTGRKSGLQVSRLHGETKAAKLDLIVSANEGPAGLELNAEYSTDLFDEARIARMLRHFEVLLQGVVEQPEQHLWELPLLEAAEWQQTVRGWNETEQFEAAASNLPELFEAQVARRPEDVAVVCGANELSYGELNRRANQLARYLNGLGVGPEQLVGLCVERSVDLVVGMLAILKAGAAYLPLDPSYPPERLAFQIADSRSEVLLTTSRLAELVQGSAKVVRLDAEWEAIGAEPDEDLPCETSAAELAYVIYTSGSTGWPKGVMVSHGSVLNLFAGINGRLGVGADEVWTNCHSAAFDFSVWELWGPLLSGGRLVIVPPTTMQAPVEQRALFASQGVTLLSLTPSGLLQVMGDGGEWLSQSEVTRVVFGGEACPAELAQQLSATGVPSWNFYGPTEATVWTSIGELKQGDTVTLGRPISNTQLYVLDHWQQPVAAGVRGEIYIGGAGLARGYWQRAELTAERFVPSPYGVGERLYRTGDEGRYLNDGRIEYLRRRDQQVKVRGYRIELGEIEAVLESHVRVRQAVVTVRDEQQLVGYVVGDWSGNEREVAAELRPYLRERLPEYMVPQRWVVLEQMPLSANGKIDRRRLPAPSGADALDQTADVEASQVEELVAAIWSEILKRESIGRDENFFELGGHSLLATQVISRVRQVFGVELPVRRLFEEATLRGLSHSIEEQLREGTGVSVPLLQRLRPEDRDHWDGLWPLSFAQQRLWFLEQLELSATYNNTKAVPLKGELNVAALERTFGEVVRRHEALRTRFVAVNGEPRQEVLQSHEFQLAITDLSDLNMTEREAAVREVIKAQNHEPFDLTRAPLLRVKLLRLSDDEHVLVLTIHHIVSDGWSMGVLIREVTTLYEAYSLGNESPLPELPVQYGDFAAWQRSWLQGEELERQLVYWRKQLGGELPQLKLPIDRERPAVLSSRGEQLNFQLTPEVSAALRELGRREGVTLFMTLLAAFQTLLHRYSGQEDILVGSNVAGRNYAEIENLIGFFANTLPLRVQLSGELTFVELLQQVKEVVLGANAHQDVPFEKLVQELQPERDLNRAPLLEVVFLLNNENDPTQKLRETANDQAITDTWVRFDLTLAITDYQTTLAGAWHYRTSLFERTTIEKFRDNFAALLESIAANPNGRLSTFEILTASEKQSSLMKKQARDEHKIQRLKALKRSV